MIQFVVIVNLLITLVNLFIAWRIWQLGCKLANIADCLTNLERSTHKVLLVAPEVILKLERGSCSLRERYGLLTVQLQRGQQILTLLNLGMKIWQGQFRGVKG